MTAVQLARMKGKDFKEQSGTFEDKSILLADYASSVLAYLAPLFNLDTHPIVGLVR